MVRLMSSAFADPLAPRELVAARERHVAVVADASCRELVGSLLAGAVLHWAGTVAVRRVDELADDRPDAIILVADVAAPAGMAALRRIGRDIPGTPVVVVARDDRKAIAARQALNAGAEAFVRADDADQTLAPALDAVMA